MNLKTIFPLFLLIGCWFSLPAQNNNTYKKVLVIGLDTLQFSSNIFYIDELAHYNNVDVYDVVELYNKSLTDALREYRRDDYRFVIADSADAAAVHAVSVYIELKNHFGDEFIGIAPAEGYGQIFFDLMKKYEAAYVLSINAYQIYHKDPPEYVSYDIKADHIIHYDIFDSALTNIYGGKTPLTSYAVEAVFLNSHYREFARGITLWLTAHEKSIQGNKSIAEYMNLLRDEKYVNASSLSLSLSFDGPYGMIGGSFARFFGRNFEANAGLGYDFSGLRIGLGGNLYFSDFFERKLKPLIGLNYAFVSGNKFKLGGRTDDYGNQLDPNDVSTYKIYADQILHLQAGLSYWMENSMLSLTAGYSYPFKGRRPKFIEGKESAGRMNFVEAINPGGLGVTVKYSFFINQRFLYRFF